MKTTTLALILFLTGFEVGAQMPPASRFVPRVRPGPQLQTATNALPEQPTLPGTPPPTAPTIPPIPANPTTPATPPATALPNNVAVPAPAGI